MKQNENKSEGDVVFGFNILNRLLPHLPENSSIILKYPKKEAFNPIWTSNINYTETSSNNYESFIAYKLANINHVLNLWVDFNVFKT